MMKGKVSPPGGKIFLQLGRPMGMARFFAPRMPLTFCPLTRFFDPYFDRQKTDILKKNSVNQGLQNVNPC